MKRLGDMAFNAGGGAINWFPGHMAAAARAIISRLRLADFVIEVRDCRIPLSSAHEVLKSSSSTKKRIIALNKKDLADPHIVNKWVCYFNACKQDCIPITAHNRSSAKKLLELVELRLKEMISREPTLLVMVVGVQNVGKSSLINSIHQIASSRSTGREKHKKAAVGPLPGVTRDISGFKIASHPSIYILDTPGVLVPRIDDIETGLRLALSGSVKDSVVGEERTAQYLLAVLNTQGIPLCWNHCGTDNGPHPDSSNMPNRFPKKAEPSKEKSKDMVTRVRLVLHKTLVEFTGCLWNEDDLEVLLERQFVLLREAVGVPSGASDARLIVSKKLLTLFRSGKLGLPSLDDVPDLNSVGAT